MTTSTITIDITPGTDIREAFVEAIRLAKLLNVNVRFSFNGTKCYTTPNGDPDRGAKNYHDSDKKFVRA